MKSNRRGGVFCPDQIGLLERRARVRCVNVDGKDGLSFEWAWEKPVGNLVWQVYYNHTSAGSSNSIGPLLIKRLVAVKSIELNFVHNAAALKVAYLLFDAGQLRQVRRYNNGNVAIVNRAERQQHHDQHFTLRKYQGQGNDTIKPATPGPLVAVSEMLAMAAAGLIPLHCNFFAIQKNGRKYCGCGNSAHLLPILLIL